MQKYFLMTLSICSTLLIAQCTKPTTEALRDVNAAWINADSNKIVVIQSVYDTQKPDKIYFEDLTATNWRIRLVATDSNLQTKTTLMEVNDTGLGDFQNHNFYYFNNTAGARAAGISQSNAHLFKLDTKEQVILKVADFFVQSHFSNAQTAPQAADLSPSPDGKYLAAYMYAPQIVIDPVLGQKQVYVQAVAFFNANSGSFAKADILNYTLTDTIPELKHYNAKAIPCYMLWDKNSAGVYVVSKKTAYYISANFNAPVRTTQVPAYALPTIGGAVNNSGVRLYRALEGTKDIIKKDYYTNWTPHAQVPLIPHGNETYSR